MTNLERFKDKISDLMQNKHDELGCACCACMHNLKDASDCKKIKCIDELEAFKWLAKNSEVKNASEDIDMYKNNFSNNFDYGNGIYL